MEKTYYFIRPYDDGPMGKPPVPDFGQILSETYMQPFNWKGRTTRKSYWLSFLSNLVLTIIATVLFAYAVSDPILNAGIRWIDYIVATVIFIWVFLASLGQTVRRLHDVNYSGYWYWSMLVPYGAWFIFYLALQPSKQIPVKWGTYLFLDNDQKEGKLYYQQPYDASLDVDNTPVPPIGQVLKEHFFEPFKWGARSTRTSFWIGTAVNFVIYFGIMLMFYAGVFIAFLGHLRYEFSGNSNITLFVILGIIGIILIAILIWLIVAQIGHTVRRLHDANLSGGWYWLILIPYVGSVLLNLLLFHPSVKEPVKWGSYLFDTKK